MIVIPVVVVVVIVESGRLHEHPPRHVRHQIDILVEIRRDGRRIRGVAMVNRLRVRDVLEFLRIVAVGGCRRRGSTGVHELVVRERSTHGRRGRGGSRSLDLARGAVAGRARGELVVVVGEIELRDGVAQAHERRGVEGVGRLGFRPETAQPNALLLLRVPDLAHPLPPPPHSNPTVLTGRFVLGTPAGHRHLGTTINTRTERFNATNATEIAPERIQHSQIERISSDYRNSRNVTSTFTVLIHGDLKESTQPCNSKQSISIALEILCRQEFIN